jgi:hypothetical protein
MSRSQYPTTNSILGAATKHGVAVRIEYGADGRVASVAMIGNLAKRTTSPIMV